MTSYIGNNNTDTYNSEESDCEEYANCFSISTCLKGKSTIKRNLKLQLKQQTSILENDITS